MSESETHPAFKAAIERGDLATVIELAKDFPPMRLDDALEVVLLMRDGDPRRYESACVKWMGRFALEGHGVKIADLENAMKAFELLRHRPQQSMERLQRLCLTRKIGQSPAPADWSL